MPARAERQPEQIDRRRAGRRNPAHALERGLGAGGCSTCTLSGPAMRLTAGIEPSDDPILNYRPKAYSVSFERRQAGAP